VRFVLGFINFTKHFIYIGSANIQICRSNMAFKCSFLNLWLINFLIFVLFIMFQHECEWVGRHVVYWRIYSYQVDFHFSSTSYVNLLGSWITFFFFYSFSVLGFPMSLDLDTPEQQSTRSLSQSFSLSSLGFASHPLSCLLETILLSSLLKAKRCSMLFLG